MQIKPLRRLIKPKYPDYYKTIRSPKLLKKCIPLSWKCKSIILGALTAFVMAGCSPGKDSERKLNRAEIHMSEEKKAADTELKTEVGSAENLIAPVFVHGDGMASSGCWAMATPPFMSEDDAKKIIESEFSKAGIKFPFYRRGKVEVKFEKISDRETPITPPPGYTKEDLREFYAFDLDNYNRKTKFGYEFISGNQAFEMHSRWDNISSGGYYTRKRAGQLAEQLRSSQKGKRIAVFYAPLSYSAPGIDKIESNSASPLTEDQKAGKKVELQRKESERLLREQVRDFIRWARKKGVLKQFSNH